MLTSRTPDFGRKKILSSSTNDPYTVNMSQCGVSCSGVIGPYFFSAANGATAPVTSELYQEMMSNFPALKQRNMGFDGHNRLQEATTHTAHVSMSLLKDLFPDHLIS